MYILGINGGVTVNQHDPSVALLKDGLLKVCIEEERLLGVKGPRGVLPVKAINACLKEEGITIKDIDLIVHPGATYKDLPGRIKDYMEYYFGSCPEIKMYNHQLCHLASAFFQSGYDSAMSISYDGFGDGLSAAYATSRVEEGIDIIGDVKSDNSLGHFYATMTSFLGFRPSEGEYMVMGLSPYGKKEYDLSDFITIDDTGFYINSEYINKNASVYEPFFNSKLIGLLGEPRRLGEKISQRHMDIAFSTQAAIENALVSLVKYVHKKSGERNLCLAGGVALNCTANKRIKELPFIDSLFVQPAASDRGLALGAALQASFDHGYKASPLTHVYYGPTYSSDEIERNLLLTGQKYKTLTNPEKTAAELISEGKIIGWFQGRSEFGPRSLGHRSILADPRDSSMKDKINSLVKFRDEFRPFAPAVTEEFSKVCFEMDSSSPFMTVAYTVKKEWRDKLPAITHVNDTARVQTVSQDNCSIFYGLIKHFGDLTGVPVVLNTSFNIKGQPIVETPLDAIATFQSTGLDALVIGDFLIEKEIDPRC